MTIRTTLALVFAFTLHAVAAPVEITPPDFRGAVQPQVAVAPSGRIHVVFGKDDAVFHISSPDGRVFSPPVKVGALEKLALGMRRGPRIVATDKLVLITAISHADGNVHAWTSADAGETWQEGARVNGVEKSAREGLQALAGDGRGLVAAVWLDARSGRNQPWSRVSRDGGATWAEEAQIYQSPDGNICECCAPSVAVAPNGEIAAMFRNWLDGARDLYVATSRDGRAFSPAEKLGGGTWKLNGCPMDGGGIAFAPAGGAPFTVWRREGTVYQARPSAREEVLGVGRDAAIAATARGPVFAWQTNARLMLLQPGAPTRVLDAAGAAPSLATAANGRSVVAVWESADTLKAEILK